MYQRSRREKAGRSNISYTSPCADPDEELSPSEGVGEHSFLFREKEEEAMKEHSATEEKGLEKDKKKKKM